jgi:hypothetical protein
MAKIHELSSLTMLPELDLFEVPPTQAAVEKSIMSEYRPLNSLSKTTSSIFFHVNSGMDEYINLDKTQLYLKAQVTLKKYNAQNTLVDTVKSDWDHCIPVNNLLHSMIKQLKLSIGDKQITASPQTYAYRALFEKRFGYSNDAKKAHLTSALYYDDNAKRASFISPSGTSGGGELGKPCELMDKLHFDFGFQNKYLLGGCRLSFELFLNEPKFYLKTKDLQTNGYYLPTVEILDACLYIYKAKLYAPIAQAHQLALEKGPAKYPFTHSRVKTHTINPGTMDEIIDHVHIGQMPRRIFVALVSHEAFNGSLITNPYYFQNFNLNYMAAFIDGEQYPTRAYQPNFTSGEYLREYLGFCNAANQNSTDSTLCLSREAWKDGNTIFGFNFAPDLSDGCGATEHVNHLRYGTLGLHLKFSIPFASPVTVIIFCEFDKLMELNNLRNAEIEY